MPDFNWYQWVVILGLPALAFGSIAIDWALWHWVWTHERELRRGNEYRRRLKNEHTEGP